jgi:hypothetical protein
VIPIVHKPGGEHIVLCYVHPSEIEKKDRLGLTHSLMQDRSWTSKLARALETTYPWTIGRIVPKIGTFVISTNPFLHCSVCLLRCTVLVWWSSSLSF